MANRYRRRGVEPSEVWSRVRHARDCSLSHQGRSEYPYLLPSGNMTYGRISPPIILQFGNARLSLFTPSLVTLVLMMSSTRSWFNASEMLEVSVGDFAIA